MNKTRLLTQSHTKRVTAAALSDAIKRNDWSNSDAGDALGCGEGTIRNRLDGGTSNNQMTVHELLRSIQTDGTEMTNAIMAEVGCSVTQSGASAAIDMLAAARATASCTAKLIEVDMDKRTDVREAQDLLPAVVSLRADMAALEAFLRSVIAENRT